MLQISLILNNPCSVHSSSFPLNQRVGLEYHKSNYAFFTTLCQDSEITWPKSRFKELSLRVKRSLVPSKARELLRLPRLRAVTPVCRRAGTSACRHGRRPRNDFVGLPCLRAVTHFGVQACTSQVLACLPQAGNDRIGKRIGLLNRNLGLEFFLTFRLETE